MQTPQRGWTSVGLALVGVVLATLSAWRQHDQPLVITGLGVMAVMGAVTVYLVNRRP